MPRDYRLPGHINFDEGFASCSDKCAILESKMAPRRIANDKSIPVIDVNNISYGGADCCDIDSNGDGGCYILVDCDGEDKKLPLAKFLYPDHVNADWDAEKGTLGEILHKPKLKVGDLFGSEGFVSEVSYGSIIEGDWIDPDTDALDLLRAMMTKSKSVPLIYGATYTTEDYEPGDDWWKYPENFINNALEYKITGAINSEGVYQYFEKGSRYPLKSELLRAGATITFDYKDKEGLPVPGYFYLGVPSGAELVCFGIFQGGHFIEFDEGWIRDEIPVTYPGNGLQYHLYRLAWPTVGKFTVRFAFMDQFDPRVHPQTLNYGGRTSLYNIMDLLYKVFQMDSEGKEIIYNEGVPVIKSEALSDYLLETYATEEDLVKEINERVRDINILKQLINGDSVDIEELKRYVYMLFPSTFGAGGSEGTVLPDTVSVGGKYVLEATVRDLDGKIHLRWNRFENNSPHGNATVYDGKTIYINENGQVAVKLNSEGPLTADSEGITLKLSDSFKMTNNGLELRISEGDIPFDNASIRWDDLNNYYYIPFDQDTIRLDDENKISVNLNSEMFEFVSDSEGIKIRHDDTIIVNSEGLGIEVLTEQDVIDIWHELMP